MSIHRTNAFEEFHYLKPDYRNRIYVPTAETTEKIKNHLRLLYKNQYNPISLTEILRLMQVYYAHKTPPMKRFEKKFKPDERFTQEDVVLITYGDLVEDGQTRPLKILTDLAEKYLENVFSTIHILPFFPYSSDRGFAVMDFEEVDGRLGTWDDISALRRKFKLMFDGVFNHVSSQSTWFQEFLNQKPYFRDFFTVFSTRQKISEDHLHLIVRPRTSDILTEFRTLYGSRLVWTTFSPDQIDLNFKNPRVLQKVIEILLTYVKRGADIIRLDAVTYLWEELGTSCVHLEQSHEIIRLFRTILNAVAPHVALITETNVPHSDNIRYFGDGQNEAQLVYNFALPPLVLHTFYTGNSDRLAEWAAELSHPSDQATYFNFLSSHDGVGVMAVRDILSAEEIERMVLRVIEYGGFVSYKDNGDGTTSVYELNTTWFSALNRDDNDESFAMQIHRYIASRSIPLVLMGVPGIYLHGLLGSKNDSDLVFEQQETRSINRKNLRLAELIHDLEDPRSIAYHVSRGLIRLLQIRKQEPSFHPNAGQRILNIDPAIFAVLRFTSDHSEQILTLVNVTSEPIMISVPASSFMRRLLKWQDLLKGRQYTLDENNLLRIRLRPYQIAWLKAL